MSINADSESERDFVRTQLVMTGTQGMRRAYYEHASATAARLFGRKGKGVPVNFVVINSGVRDLFANLVKSFYPLVSQCAQKQRSLRVVQQQ